MGQSERMNHSETEDTEKNDIAPPETDKVRAMPSVVLL